MCAVSNSGYVWVVLENKNWQRVKGLSKYDSYEEAKKALAKFDKNEPLKFSEKSKYSIHREWI